MFGFSWYRICGRREGGICDERESEDLTVLIYTRQKTSERTNERTNDMTKAEGFLTNQKKHLELHETSRTPTIVLSCLRVLIESSRMLDHARSLAARVQERKRFPTDTRADNTYRIEATLLTVRADFGLAWIGSGQDCSPGRTTRSVGGNNCKVAVKSGHSSKDVCQSLTLKSHGGI
jgi:hypothetical protein